VRETGDGVAPSTVVRLSRIPAELQPRRLPSREAAMAQHAPGREEYTWRQDFLIRITIELVMFYGFLVRVSLLSPALLDHHGGAFTIHVGAVKPGGSRPKMSLHAM
jgi:hypothetical protein